MLDPWPPLRSTSDNVAYVALPRWHAVEGAIETTEDDLAALDRRGASATASAPSRGAPASGATYLEAEVDLPVPNETPTTRERVHAILPPSVLADRERTEIAAAARREGGLVPAEPGDDGATLALKGRLARLHLKGSDDGMHERALATLDEIASGDVTATHVTKKGEKVTVPLHPRFRAAAAKAILTAAQAAAKTGSGKVEIANANIVAAGDLIANVDPEKLRAAVARLRRGSV